MAQLETPARPVINSREMLIFVLDEAHDQFATRQVFHTFEDVANEVNQQYEPCRVKDILRLDLETLSVVSLSEEVAEAWLSNNDYSDGVVPVFVATSDMHDAFLSDDEDEAESDRIYGSYTQQHRLTVRDVI